MAMVQDPGTAKYDGMPKSAIATGMVDFIVPVEKMPETLLSYIRHPFLKAPGKIKLSENGAQKQLNKMHGLIRSATGHDFSKYKPSTIQRRIERRMAVHQLEKLADYIVLLQKSPSEIKALLKDMLIGVTSFFRDPEAFEILAQQGVAKLMQNKKSGESLRIWVAGCSTGEEAYSLAMVFSEALADLDKRLDVKIFASDIDETAIEIARRGVYPDSIAVDVSKERLKRFFTKDQGAFKVKKQIRDMVIFSPQSIIKDPPFSRLDLVSCRNLLIYLGPTLQKKIIPLLHYALTAEGILFLGSAETIGEFTDLFQPLNSKWRIYKRKAKNPRKAIDYPAALDLSYKPDRLDGAAKRFEKADLHALTEKTILEQFAPAAVLIDDKYEILHFVGRTEKYLVPPTGKPSFNLLSMTRSDLKYDLTAALHQAVREKKPASRKGIRIQYTGGRSVVDLTINPFTGKDLPSGLLLVVFEDKTPEKMIDDVPLKTSAAKIQCDDCRQLQQELQSTREYLHATIEELETSNEELKSANEELQSVNEEMQSTNEELETSKEELQSTNEELNTVNAELQIKVHELARSGDDLNNLLAASDIASIFLDTHLCIQRYTPAAARIIKLIPTDIGRPLDDLKTSFPQVDLAKQTLEVLDNLNSVEKQIMSEDHVWYQLKVMPYRTRDNVIDGAVLTLTNIQQQVHQSEDQIRRFVTVLEDSNDAITVQDFNGRILAWNKGAEMMYGWNRAEALKMNIADLIPEDRQKETQALINKIQKGETVRSFKTQRKTKTGHVLEIWLTATLLTDQNGRPVEMATTERNLAWLAEVL